jgi:hypothetical protein
MSARHSATTSGSSSADPLRDPDLGWRPFGYSKRKTKALIGLAAALIEELTAQIVQQQSAQTATEARLVKVTAEAEETRAKLETSRAESADLPAEKAERGPNEVEPAMISAALISAHQAAAEILAQARHTAAEILTTARSDSTTIEEEANHVIEQAEIRAHSLVEQAAQEAESLRAESEQLTALIERERQLWTRFLRRALDATGQVAVTQEPDDTAEQPTNVEDEQEHPKDEKDDREGQEKDLEGDLYGAIKGTDEP